MNSVFAAGVLALGEGRYLAALDAFRGVAKQLPRSPAAIANIGIAQLGLWRVAEAVASLTKATEMRAFLEGDSIRRQIAPSRALASALLGDLEQAGARLADCEALNVDSAPVCTLARTVLASRAGEWAAARALLIRPEMKMLGGPNRGLSDALLAWVTEQVSGTHPPVDLVALFGESGPDALTKLWPDFAAFLHRAARAPICDSARVCEVREEIGTSSTKRSTASP